MDAFTHSSDKHIFFIESHTWEKKTSIEAWLSSRAPIFSELYLNYLNITICIACKSLQIIIFWLIKIEMKTFDEKLVQFDHLLQNTNDCLKLTLKWLCKICTFCFSFHCNNPRSSSKKAWSVFLVRSNIFLFLKGKKYIHMRNVVCWFLFRVFFCYYWSVFYTDKYSNDYIFVSSRLHSVNKIESTIKETKMNRN